VLQSFILYPIQLASISLRGWFRAGLDTIKIIFLFLKGASLFQHLFAIACLAAGIAAFLPWIHYRVDFLGMEEVFIGSNFKFIFGLVTPSGLFFLLFPIPFKRMIFYILFTAVALSYLGGLIYENPIHTKMINPTDYTILPGMYVYGILLSICGLLAFTALKTDAVDYSWLFEPLNGEIKINKQNTSFAGAKKNEMKVIPREIKKKTGSEAKSPSPALPHTSDKIKYDSPGFFRAVFLRKNKSEKKKTSSKKNLNIKIAR